MAESISSKVVSLNDDPKHKFVYPLKNKKDAKTTLEILRQVIGAAHIIAHILPAISKVIRSLEEEFERINQAVKTNGLSVQERVIQAELSLLNRDVQFCGIKAEEFLNSIESMARYGTFMSGITEEDFKEGINGSLQQYVQTISKRLSKVSKKFDEFRVSHRNAQEKAETVMEQYKQKAQQQQEQESNGSWLVAQYFASAADTVVWLPQASLNYCKRAFRRDLGSDVDAPTRRNGYVEEIPPPKNGFHKAEARVADMIKSMDKQALQIKQIDDHIAQAMERINKLDEDSLEVQDKSSWDGLIKAQIMKDLRDFRLAMEKILDNAKSKGDDIDSGAVISNTVAERVSEETENIPNPRNPVDLNFRKPAFLLLENGDSDLASAWSGLNLPEENIGLQEKLQYNETDLEYPMNSHTQ